MSTINHISWSIRWDNITINDNFDALNNDKLESSVLSTLVSKTWNVTEDIDWLKTFKEKISVQTTSQQKVQYGNWLWSDTRSASAVWYTKWLSWFTNYWVDWFDSDAEVIGTRRRSFWGYLNNISWTLVWIEEFMSFSFPTFDGISTYTKQIFLNAPTVINNTLQIIWWNPWAWKVLTSDASWNWTWQTLSSVGDMQKSTYDTTNNGIVDNSEKLNNQSASYYTARTNHIGNETTLPFDITRTWNVNKWEIAWDNDKENFIFGVDGDSVPLWSPFDIYRNNTGSTIPLWTNIMATWTLWASGRITIAPYTIAIDPKYIVGITKTAVTNGSDVIWYDDIKIKWIDTTGSAVSETWADWDILYAHPTQAGKFTKVQPTAPNPKMALAFVVKAHTNGTLRYRRTDWTSIANDNLVELTTLSNGDILIYNSSTGRFENWPKTTANITDSTNKRYVTDAQLTVIGNTSWTNTWDNAVNTLYSGLVSNATHTWDVTWSTALTLATVNSNVWSFWLAGSIAQFIVNAKGLITSAVNVVISITASQVSDFTSSVNALITGKANLTWWNTFTWTQIINANVGIWVSPLFKFHVKSWNVAISETITPFWGIDLAWYQAVDSSNGTWSLNKAVNGSFSLNVLSILEWGSVWIWLTATNRSTLEIKAGISSSAPIGITTSWAVLKTTPIWGDIEVDSNWIPYYTFASSQRWVNLAEQFITLTSAYTLTSQTAVQKLFNSPTNGTLWVSSWITYKFKCFFSLTSLSATSWSFWFAIWWTATLTSIAWTSQAIKAATLNTAWTLQTTFNSTASNTTLVTASTSTNWYATIEWTIRVNVWWTIIPQVSLWVAAAAIVWVNSYYNITAIWTNTVQSVGNWS